jgi:hypothetical protein
MSNNELKFGNCAASGPIHCAGMPGPAATLKKFFILLALPISLTLAHAEDINVGRLVDTIAMKETGAAWNGHPGSHGELSAYQFLESVWDQHMAPRPFSEARVASLAQTCAIKHVQWLINQMKSHGLTVTPQRIATAWNHGLGYLYRHVREQTNYGIEVANLYYGVVASGWEYAQE